MNKNSYEEGIWIILFCVGIGLLAWYFLLKPIPLDIECHSYDGRYNITVSIDNTRWVNPKIPINGYFGIIDNKLQTFENNFSPVKTNFYYNPDDAMYEDSVFITFNNNILYLMNNHKAALFQPYFSASTRYPMICYEYYQLKTMDIIKLKIKQNVINKLGSSNG